MSELKEFDYVNKSLIGGGGRIQYLDALRGFTMLLVVMTHVSGFCLGVDSEHVFSYSKVFGEFRMPLFFFVSGFVLYKVDYEWNLKNTWMFLKKKINVQIVSPFLFLLIYIYNRNFDLEDALLDEFKYGYWFTFALFEFFCFYIFLQWIIRYFQIKSWLKDVVVLGFGLFLYVLIIISFFAKLGLSAAVSGALGISQWKYFLFFVLGTRVKKYFTEFELLLDSKYFTMILVFVFFGLNIFPEISRLSLTSYNLISSISGMLLVFAMFRKKQSYFTLEKRIGRVAQFVGRRTLDIYLLHYFFIFTNMSVLLPNFSLYNSPLLEFICSLAISVLVLSACLFVSSVLRLNPILAHFLFGQKLNNKY